MKQGIVMEIKKRFCVVLTPEGEFIRLPKKDNYLIGEEIIFPKDATMKFKLPAFSFPKTIGALAVACMLLFFTFIPFQNDNKVFAYVSLDINPSIELGINNELKVVEMTPFNEEGRFILESIDNWEGKHIEDVTNTIIDKFLENGYLHEEDHLVIGTVFADEEHVEIKSKVNETIKNIQQTVAKEKIETETVSYSLDERNVAVQSGKTVGKYYEEKKKHEEPKQATTKEKRHDHKDKGNKKDKLNNGKPKKDVNPKAEHKNDKINKGKGPNKYASEKGNNGKAKGHDKEKQKHNEKRNDKDKDKHREKNKEKDKAKSNKENNRNNNGKGNAKSNHENSNSHNGIGNKNGKAND